MCYYSVSLAGTSVETGVLFAGSGTPFATGAEGNAVSSICSVILDCSTPSSLAAADDPVVNDAEAIL